MYCVPWYFSTSKVSLQDPTFESEPCMDGLDPELGELKERVGIYKIRHGDAKWKASVASVDKAPFFAGSVPTPVSRAYYKLLEILRTCAIKPPQTALHLCEAPGGFAQAVVTEFPKARVSVTSRRSEGAPHFSPAILHHDSIDVLKLAHGSDLLRQEVRDELVELVQGAELITADGGIDNDDRPELTEHATAHLILCEIDAATRIQRENGTFVLKVFGCSLDVTQQLVALLCCCYREVAILKPFTSRSVNDERYIVASGFERARAPRLAIPDAPAGPFLTRVAVVDDEWRAEARRICHKMVSDQRRALESALSCTSSDVRRPPSRGGRGRHGQTPGRAFHPYPHSRGRGRQRTHTSGRASTT